MDEAKRNLHGMKTRALTIIGVEGDHVPLLVEGINFVVVRVGNRRQRVGPLGLCRPPCRGPPRSRPRPLPHARLGWCGGFRGGGGVERGTGSAEA